MKMGYNIKFIWEHDFDAKMKKDKRVQKSYRKSLSPL